ncbi:D-alanyl-D-alanine carboxypeptidase [Ameyamaea chiangmaiensis]|uniref:D-alanyl-D-alanine carboxypeptidase n=2 Tax=Ameyamaea chiangmaiensis TaxID=442969 RepID=A0A850PFJ6_9PROT|nr:D-alanyl-D-alanine carboxypeptidase [Ameyamaea chiangmaiensis]NVN41220.1 D-alanyl-D-alanine carboxypeptidase [Ameyamaea chiangmaiensis]
MRGWLRGRGTAACSSTQGATPSAVHAGAPRCFRSDPRRTVALARAAGLLACLTGGVLASARPAHAQYVGQISAFVIDSRTGAVLSQLNPDLRRYPASLTKLMTLYVAFKALRNGQITLDQAVPVSAHASSMEPSKLGLVPGTYLTVEQAILGLVTKSANDAACALGELIAGGDESRFAAIMTQQAQALGMTNTVFRNASGLPDPEQMTTARDLSTLTRHLIADFPDDYHYFAVPGFLFHGHLVPNHDPMLKIYPGADGLKTGYTADAGHNLVTSAVRDDVRLVGVVMGARTNPQRSVVMAHLLDDGFAQEGVAPVVRPLVMARTRRRFGGRAAIALAAASRSIAGSAPAEVAELPETPRHGQHGRLRHVAAPPLKHAADTVRSHAPASAHGAHVRLVSTRVPAHPAHRKTRG